jgi:3-oxoacyl-[acyl-carrier-protein] synthase II
MVFNGTFLRLFARLPMKRRVAVTGMGAVTPLGNDVVSSWEALVSGRSGIDWITRFDTQDFKTKIAGEVRGFDPLLFMDRKQIKRTDMFVQYALAASQMALQDATVQMEKEDPHRVGVVIGTAIGGISHIEQSHSVYLQEGVKKISPLFIVSIVCNMAAGQVAMATGAKGHHTCPVTACAAGTHAIGDAFRVIQRGDADLMISGGAESALTPLVIGGLQSMKATTTREVDPSLASCPFSKQRDGMVPAEGAGILILEEWEHAQGRSAKILAEIIGYGVNNDAYHVTAPDPEGLGAARCMEIALTDAGISPAQIDYINAHGTSTPLNDVTETLAIKTVFGEHAYRLLISSNKSMVGHLWGAAGAVEAIFTVMSMQTGIVPPTINLVEPDPQCDLDYVPREARPSPINFAVSNSFGFGGTNGVLVFKSATAE